MCAYACARACMCAVRMSKNCYYFINLTYIFFRRHFLEDVGASEIAHRTANAPEGIGAKFFLCGPPALVHDVRAMLSSFGAHERDILYEKWAR